MTATTTKIQPNSADRPATPRKPRSAATNAIMKKTSAQCSMVVPSLPKGARARERPAESARSARRLHAAQEARPVGDQDKTESHTSAVDGPLRGPVRDRPWPPPDQLVAPD